MTNWYNLAGDSNDGTLMECRAGRVVGEQIRDERRRCPISAKEEEKRGISLEAGDPSPILQHRRLEYIQANVPSPWTQQVPMSH